jgi:predicted O-linked N-acetylglucosamine transferase (SPINDLY family)
VAGRDELYRDVVGGVDGSAELSIVDFTTRLDRAIDTRSLGAVDLNELGQTLFLEGAIEAACLCYGHAAKDPRAIGAHANLGRCEIRLGRPGQAEARARDMLARVPDNVPGWQLLGEALAEQGRYAEAVAAFEGMVTQAPGHSVLYLQLGQAHEWNKDPEKAREVYARGFALNPQDVRCLSSLIFIKRRLCDWRDLDALGGGLKDCVRQGRGIVSPLDFLSEGATAELERMCAAAQAVDLDHPAARRARMPFAQSADKGRRLRVGFVSYGFGMHPTTILTVALFEQLRDSAIETYLFSTNPDPDSPLRRRIAAAAHTFEDVGGMSAGKLAARIRAASIDVLIDLDGYCRLRKPEVFAYRPAPVQASWLGYPGTTGANFIDYVIADRFVVPESMRKHFSEHVAYLPRCYQCTDPTRVVHEPPSREGCGLPDERSVVYACFNSIYKMNPRSVTRMIRILREVPGSVLWLLDSPGGAPKRLRDFAASMGVEPNRLVFMERLPHELYLARYRHVDLFLDTEYYNAHTTASDALWAGCPVLTRPGETFASRVAGSLNYHLGLDEMNVSDDEAFVAAGVRYGLDAHHRVAIRDRLEGLKSGTDFFDIGAYARDFAALLQRMVNHARAGKRPEELSFARAETRLTEIS